MGRISGRGPTSRDVARIAQVSQATVSMVLNNRKDVVISEETRKRVLQAAQELNYRPYRAARALKTGKSQSIAMWTNGFYEAYFTQALQYFRTAVKSDGYDMHLVETGDIVDKESVWDNITAWPMDGLVIFESPQYANLYAHSSLINTTPAVCCGGYWNEEIDYVGLDLYEGILEAMDHLFSTGRKKIIYISDPGETVGIRNRITAYAEKMEEFGQQSIFIHIASPDPASHRRAGYETIKNYLNSNSCPEAIVCQSDAIAIGVLRALYELEIRVPNDTALIGCDGIEETLYHHPQITTIAGPLDEMACIAWQFLKNRIENQSIVQQHIVLKPKLLIRGSSI